MSIVLLSSGRYPPNVFADQDSEVDLIGSDDSARGSKSGLDSVTVSRMNMRRQFFKFYEVTDRHAPKFETALIHRQSVVIDVPCPKRDARGVECKP